MGEVEDLFEEATVLAEDWWGLVWGDADGGCGVRRTFGGDVGAADGGSAVLAGEYEADKVLHKTLLLCAAWELG